MMFWTFCFLVSTWPMQLCVPVEDAPTFATEEACLEAWAPWWEKHSDEVLDGTYMCDKVNWQRT